ncbi:hypothetical protein RRG08_046295 [Elysia crispata]|uniref:Uncharacterized protein n=1 Tax=Elysia crispata TaxID=231223 RepID=A0AAE0YLA4_9GAST|nr:hypothetical protein RRG08_046295 [Elysia crispata]
MQKSPSPLQSCADHPEVSCCVDHYRDNLRARALPLDHTTPHLSSRGLPAQKFFAIMMIITVQASGVRALLLDHVWLPESPVSRARKFAEVVLIITMQTSGVRALLLDHVWLPESPVSRARKFAEVVLIKVTHGQLLIPGIPSISFSSP